MSRKKQKTKSKTVSNFKNRKSTFGFLSGKITPKRIVEQFFNKKTPYEIIKDFRSLSKLPNIALYINSPVSNNFHDLYVRRFSDQPLSKSFSWCISLLVHHSEKIQYYINKAEILNRKILNSNLMEASILLDAIDRECGVSIWSANIRGSISKEKSIESINVFYKTSVKNTESNPYALYLFKSKFDDLKDEDIFFTSLRGRSQELKAYEGSKTADHLSYKTIPFNLNDKYDYQNIINIEKHSSIVDIFNSILDLLAYYRAYASEIAIEEKLIKLGIETLNKSIAHPVIRGYAQDLGINNAFSIDENVSAILDLYTEGSYDEVCKKVKSDDLIRDFALIEIAVKSNIRCNSLELNNFLGKIARSIYSVLSRDANYSKSVQSLVCVSNCYRGIPWFDQLGLFILREAFSPEEKSRNFIDRQLSVTSALDTPKKHKYISNQRVLPPLSSIKNSSCASLFCSNSLENRKILNSNVETQRAEKYIAEYELYKGRNKIAIDILEKLSGSDDALISFESNRLLVNALLRNEQTEDAVERFSKIALGNKNNINLFDTIEIIKKATPVINYTKSIYPSIAVSFHSRLVDSAYDSTLRHAFNSFLDNNRYELPQELFGKEEEIGRDELYYFLEWVCTPNTMKLCLSFKNNREIEEARLEICTYLMGKVDNTSKLQNEVREITQQHAVREAAHYVDNSRIYVDISGFHGRNSDQYKTLFNRYIELSSKPNQDDNKGAFDGISNLLLGKVSENSRGGYLKSASIIHIPEMRLSERDSVFISLSKLIRSEFTHGDRGLNNHLSTRIRHGVLPTHLSKPLKDENIFVTPATSKEKFISSSPLFSGSTPFELENADILWENIRDFSTQYSELISKINDEWLQVKSLDVELSSIGSEEDKRKTREAIFDYSISPLEAYIIQKELPLSPDYDDVIRVCVQWMWDKTEYNLIEVKNKIKSIAKPSAIELLNKLNTSVTSSIPSSRALREFQNSLLRVKADLETQFDTICSWFSHSDNELTDTYKLETAIDIAKKSINIKVNSNLVNSIMLNGRALSYLVDIFFMLFENASSKSGCNHDDLQVEISAIVEDERLVFEIRNNCQLENSIEECNKKIQFYKDAYGNEMLINDCVQEEGGTGFFKIWKILAKDLSISHELDMGYIEDENNDFIFYVRLILNQTKSMWLDGNTNS